MPSTLINSAVKLHKSGPRTDYWICKMSIIVNFEKNHAEMAALLTFPDQLLTSPRTSEPCQAITKPIPEVKYFKHYFFYSGDIFLPSFSKVEP